MKYLRNRQGGAEVKYSELEILGQNINSASTQIEEQKELMDQIGLNTAWLLAALKSLSSAKKMHKRITVLTACEKEK